MRKFFALVLGVSIFAVTAVVSIWSDDISPGQQHELASLMATPIEATPVFIPADPGPGTHIPGPPPVYLEGSTPVVEAHCNSPGRL